MHGVTKDCCNKFFNKKIIFQIRICGPAQSGKTSFVKYLLHNKFLKVKPTEGLFVEKIDFEEFSVIIWDSRYSIEDDVIAKGKKKKNNNNKRTI
ncbi:ADP-ribosylation factor, putative [Plasmodium ovale curtisi]|uniref:ADP-ribosylation factor, putative n=1 Tax=Plasmodium ovale curtisi TaxID=864141 RepID=A0A1A8VYU0_PLAOA|nr:ADP-ribosylation factor, putative [Plasmodium ovale curtisi]